MRKVAIWSVVAAAMVALTLIINAGVFAAGWRWDDPSILLHAHQFSFVQDLVDPAVWQQASPANLTPLLFISMEVDLILAGMSTWFFYLHQLLVLAAAAFLLVVLLRHWCAPQYAAAGGILFLCGLPVMVVAEQLMTRHYAEGLVLTLLAIVAFVRYLRTGAVTVLALAVLCYILAVMAKEVYVPLPVLLLCLPESTWRQRMSASLPFFMVAIAYAFWRSWMLPDTLGGYAYGANYFSQEWIQQALATYSSFPRLLSGSMWPVFAGAYLFLLGMYLWRKHSDRSQAGFRKNIFPAFAVLVAALVLAPLAPLVQTPGIAQADRYLFAVWAAFSFSAAFFAGRYSAGGPSSWVSLTAVMALVVLSAVHAIPQRQQVAAVGRAFDVQGAFLWQYDDSVAYQPSAEVLPSLWFATDLAEFKARIGAGTSPVIVVDDIFLSEAAGKPLFSFDVMCACMRDASAEAQQRLQQSALAVRQQAPLSVNFAYRSSVISWKFGPYTSGSYQLVSNRIGVINAPAIGSMRAILAEGAGFYIRYQSPEGWLTYSDLFQVVHNGPEIVWVRE